MIVKYQVLFLSISLFSITCHYSYIDRYGVQSLINLFIKGNSIMKVRNFALTAALLGVSASSVAKVTVPIVGNWEHTTYSSGHDVVQSTQSADVMPKPEHKMPANHADYIRYTVKYLEQSKPHSPLLVISAAFYEDSLMGNDEFFNMVDATDGYIKVDKPQSIVIEVNDQKVAFKRTYLSPHQYVMHPETLQGLTYVISELTEGKDLHIKGNQYGDYRIEADGFKDKLEIDDSSKVL